MRVLNFVVIAVAVAPSPPLAADEVPAGRWKGQVTQHVGRLTEKRPVAGLVVGVLPPAGDREFYGFGRTRAGGPVPAADTVFQVGSLTKPMTALVLARLAGRGDLRLDDPARLHLPEEFPLPRRGEREITLVELATHTSGLPALPPNLTLGVLLRGIAMAPDPDPYGEFGEGQLAEGLRYIELEDVARPRFSYSNLGMGLLGHALAARAGKSFGQLLRDEVAGPLGMADTAVELSGCQEGRLAAGHDGRGQEVPAWTFASMPGCGAAYSTADDLLKLLAAECGRCESELDGAMRLTQEPRHPASASMHVGLGWLIRDIGGRRVWWHNGGTGGYTAYAAFCRDPACAVVVLCNSGPDALDHARALNRLGEGLIGELIEGPGGPK